MMIAARLGFLSTNTELYALVLAYISGFYFIASVVLLRTQLPIEYVLSCCRVAVWAAAAAVRNMQPPVPL